MNATTLIILTGAAAAVLGILILKLGKRLAYILLALGGMGAMGAMAYALAAQAQATRQIARVAEMQAITNAGMSAATTLIAFLLTVIIVLLLAIAGAIIGQSWWQKRQKRQRFAEMAEALQLYALLDGARATVPVQRSAPALPHQATSGIPIIVFPTATPQGIALDDLAAAMWAIQGQGQGRDPFTNLLPPEGGTWEVVE